MKQFPYHWPLLLLLALCLWACATMQMPNGGPRDLDPPKLLASIPADGTTNYKGNKIILYFDEPIVEEKLKQELIISPYSRQNYKVKVKRNKFYIELLDSLQPNTTYHLDFRNALKDVREKNIAKGIKVSFSTGPTIDALEVGGVVTDLWTGKPVKNTTVGFYPASDTMDIEKGAPRYFSRTNDAGQYTLERMPAGKYKVYALEGKDNPLRYAKQEEERIAFLDTLYEIKDNFYNLDFRLAHYDSKPLKQQGKPARNGKEVTITYNKPLLDYQLKVEGQGADSLYDIMGEKGEIKLVYFGEQPLQDSLLVRYTAIDSLGQNLAGEQKIFFKVEEEEKKGRRKKEEEKTPKRATFSFKLLSPTQTDVRPKSQQRVKLIFPVPIASSQPDSMLLAMAGDTIPLPRAPKFGPHPYLADLGDYQADSSYTLIFKKGAFISALGDSSDAQKIGFQLLQEEKTGVIAGTVEGDAKHFIVQLLDMSYKVLEEAVDARKFRFDYLKPGEYRLRLLIDENGDGEWSKGNFKEQLLPEKIIQVQKTYKVKELSEFIEEENVLRIY